jgi:hypothetical protein
MIYSLKYTDKMKEGLGGYARLWFVRIRPKYKDDQGILAHELEHVRQWWCNPIGHGLMYLFIKSYRRWAEVRAYKIQLALPPANGGEHFLKHFAGALSTKYGLKISVEEAERLLRT